MHRLVASLLVTTAVCAITRPGQDGPPPGVLSDDRPLDVRPLVTPHLQERLLYKSLIPPYRAFDTSSAISSPFRRHNWLDKEILRLRRMNQEDQDTKRYDTKRGQRFAPDPDDRRDFDGSVFRSEIPMYMRQTYPPSEDMTPRLQILANMADQVTFLANHPMNKQRQPVELNNNHQDKSQFALTPADKGYYVMGEENKAKEPDLASKSQQEAGDAKVGELLEPPRQTRQNPNWKTKTLVASDIEKIKARLLNEDGVSSTTKASIVNARGNSTTTSDSIYGIAFMAAICAVAIIAVVAFVVGWYTLSKKAKAAAEVDYPAYGVTGPTVDTSGDRKLAHSAHMYHYQHQKQQIIAMERSCLEQRNGSISDPESEEENEEGDYTVYECPGFATTGAMEVKNPMFSEEPTPTTPGKCEIVKPQPEE